MSKDFHQCRVQVLKMHHKYITSEMRHEFKVQLVFLDIADREEIVPLEEFITQDQIFLKMNLREPVIEKSEYELSISAKWLKDNHVPDGAWKK